MGVANGTWRRLHGEEFNSLYRSPNIVRVIKFKRLRLAGHLAKMVEYKSDLKIVTDKSIGRRLLGMPRYICEIQENSNRCEHEVLG